MSAASLLCPDCGTSHAGEERFCPLCGMPLVAAPAEAQVDERQERARKIDPRYADGPLVWAAGARNQVEAEFIAGLLLEEGVPSLIRRAAGFDVPAPPARDVLLETGIRDPAAAPVTAASGTRLIAGLLLAVAVVAIVLFMATHTWD
jgi:hypothetical protein